MPCPTVLLFDIDGTLIRSDGVGRRALERAFAERHGSGEATRHFSLAGMTDRAIARRGLERLGVQADEAAIAALLEAYVGFLDAELREATLFEVLPGIEAALDAAARQGHVAVGLGTGNVRAGAAKKLGHARLWHRFAFGGFADDHEERSRLIRAGAERGAAQLRAKLADCRVLVVGDTPLDVAAAHDNDFDCLALATGQHPLDELRACSPRHCFPDLSARGALEALLGTE
jgi:phosphoglycolate phosphatase-like HAD superfamily hydrolase